ncbi:MAG: hypothetical protein IJO88_00345 [Oscillospiraceae bacterium]|nr:hypothetical protein [Oscillospiraceae bacterium]
MKRKIAIVLTALSIALCLVACGGRNDSSTVSESNNGRIEDSRTNTQHDTRDGSRSTSGSTKDSSTNSSSDSGFMDDMRDAADSAGDAIGDAGRAIGDAVTGQEANSGSGMTGTR